MLLIADSGGTKTDWLLGDGAGEPRTIRTSGLNPNVFPEAEIRRTICERVRPWVSADKVSAVYFFGAGLGIRQNREFIKAIIEEELKVGNVRVESDLLAAAFAAFGHRPGVLAILGTGSVAFRYDGRQIQKRCGGWGFLLGDEGSGIALGKAMVRLYLEHRLPEHLADLYSEFVGLKPDDLLWNVYSGQLKNEFLAGQTHFLSRHKSDPWIFEFLISQLERFFKSSLELCLNDSKEHLVFSGGVAENFFGAISHLCQSKGWTQYSLMRSPFIRPLFHHLLRLSDKI